MKYDEIYILAQFKIWGKFLKIHVHGPLLIPFGNHLIYSSILISHDGHFENGCHFFPAAYRQGSPPRSCAGRSPKHVDTQHVFTTAQQPMSGLNRVWPLGHAQKVSNLFFFKAEIMCVVLDVS